MRKPTQYEIEQTVLLGAQVSYKNPEFQTFAKMDTDTAFIVWLIENRARLEKANDEKAILAVLTTIGELGFLQSTTEITRLAMIVGDTRARIDMKKAMADARKIRLDTPA